MGSSKKAKYRVAIIGTGNHGTRFARTFQLNPLTEVVAGVNPSQANLDLFCKRFDVPGYQDYREMLDKEEIDIAAPILPVKPNPEVVIACARAGVKAIMSEKPIAASLDETDRMVEECRSRGIPLAAGDMYRNSPNLWKAKEVIDSGEIGEVQSINLYGTGGNQMTGQGCRGLTEMSLFAGDGDIDFVFGRVDGDAADRDRGTIDEWSDYDQGMGGCVRYANGIEGFLHSKSSSTRHGIEVVCSKGVFQSNQSRHNRMWKAERGGELEEMEGLFLPPDPNESRQDYDEDGWQYMRRRMVETVQSIIDALEQGIEPRCSGEDLRRALEVTIALRESHRRGMVAVKLPLEDRSLKIIPMRGRWLGRRLHAEYSTEVWTQRLHEMTSF